MKNFDKSIDTPKWLFKENENLSPLNDGKPFILIDYHQVTYDLNDWLTIEKDLVNKLLLKHGGILFRGFNINTVEKFNTITTSFNSEPIPYMFRSSPRYSLGDHVYLSTTYPSSRKINMHSESSYSYVWGQKIMFCCITEPIEGGETPIADNRLVMRKISNELLKKFDEHGIIYQRTLSPHVSMGWPEVFQTEDRQAVLGICKENDISCNFLNDQELIIRWKRPALAKHPLTGDKIWFNHAFFFNKYSILDEMGLLPDEDIPDDLLPSNTFFGDGSEISHSDYLELRSAYETEKTYFKWKKGDVLLLDNMLTAHGRSPYKGDRKIIVAIMEPTS
ncbi:Taurine dioxygenase, alpha-ketoglutarate-dependent [Pedobacter terrae]|uniref:Taurine dioxygenase, alpha-ketoglutarate-dependent n=1 Tax=Pedobacter terrae TaxID=405671 RepID=A0A1G8EK85_9SPHI|nr:TauD/TfdA family dioxygenase [Pedobacter terrae]SDH70251.1 Taurine dioxygenase, alpha-ketoglutarate-dependent [Pedobacter terrae]